MFNTPAIALVNRLLAKEAWARDELRAHVGKVATICAVGVKLRFRVGDDGTLVRDDGDLPADVAIEVPTQSLPQLFDGAESVSRHARVSGDAHFAETIARLMRHLRPDLGATLSPLLGDVLARRVEMAVGGAADSIRTVAQNVGANVFEYVTEEKEWVVKRSEGERLTLELSTLRDDLGRLEKRLDRLSASA